MLGSLGCSTYVSDLDRAEKHFQAKQHEQALALFRVLEPDMNSLGAADRARYAYLRGMNNYRLSGQAEDSSLAEASAKASDVDNAYRAHARYWLGMALALEQVKAGSLRAEWKANADVAMRDLNQDVYGIGVFVDEADSINWDDKPAANPDADDDIDD